MVEATEVLVSPSREQEREPSMQDAFHRPVMSGQALEMLHLKPGAVVMDATIGLAGHAREIIRAILPKGQLIGIDKDEESLAIARERLKDNEKRCWLVQEDFRNLDKALESLEIDGVDAFLFDLGISSYQLENPGRGFSLKAEGPLDMRMDRRGFISAYDLLNNLTEEEISTILWRFGEERFSRRIARAFVKAREKAPLASTRELAELVTRVLPYKARFGRIHPATRTFQALRIAVNRELDALEEALQKAALFLSKKGRICVISFHSLEDRIVKESFRRLAKTGRFRLVVKKVLRPSSAEIAENPRSRSAKMRVIERVR